MSSVLACARTRESAVRWLENYDPEDGDGPLGEKARDPLNLFTTECVLDAYMGGVAYAEDQWTVERATGQRQLDDATALMREAAGLFQHYARHHRIAADVAERAGDLPVAKTRLEKAQRNLLMASRLLAWLAGDDRYPVSLPGEDTMACHAQPFPIPADIAPDGQLVPSDHKTREACHERFANRPNYGTGQVNGPESNVRRVDIGPLSDPGVVGGLVSALAGEAKAISMAGPVFRLQTPDPRFDPHQPVVINGFTYRPATEE